MHKTFKASVAVRSAFIFALIAAPLISWAFRNTDGAVWLHLFSAVAVICVFLAWPRTIHFDSDRIWQKGRFGRARSIPWTDVDSLAHVIADGKTIVGGGNVQIVHNFLHTDKADFCKVIEQRTAHRAALGVWPNG